MPTWSLIQEDHLRAFAQQHAQDNPGITCSELSEQILEESSQFPQNMEAFMTAPMMAHEVHENNSTLVECDCAPVVAYEFDSDSGSEPESYQGDPFNPAPGDERPPSPSGSTSSKNSGDSDSTASNTSRSPGDYVTMLIPHIAEDLSKFVYSIGTLKSLIPAEPEFSGLRTRVGVLKVVRRFHTAVSNRRYRKWYYKHHKKFVPVNHPRTDVVLENQDTQPKGRANPVFERDPPFGGKAIRLVRKVVKGRVLNRARPVFVLNFQLKHSRAGAYPIFKNGKYHTGTKQESLRARKPYKKVFKKRPPDGRHTKYWYFLRKRGVWYPSVHHPYSDE